MIVDINNNPDVVAVIPTLGKDISRLIQCVESLENQETDLRLALVCIVNNAANTGLESVLPNLTNVTIVYAGINLGFSGALNFGRQFVKASYLWCIQDDMRVHKTCLEQLFLFLNKDPKTAVVSPIVVSESGEVRRGSCGGILQGSGYMERWLPEVSVTPDKLDELEKLSYIPSRGMLFKVKAWDAIKGPDPRYYPVLWTDVDLCMNLQKNGWKFSLVTSATVYHETNGSTPSMLGQFLAHRNNRLFIEKWVTSPNELKLCNSVLEFRKINDQINPELLSIVAQSAADALLELGQDYTEKMQQMERKNHELISSYEGKIKDLMIEQEKNIS